MSELARVVDDGRARPAGGASQFDGARDLAAVGAALGVGSVLEGSVRRIGQRVRITGQLIRVADGFHFL